MRREHESEVRLKNMVSSGKLGKVLKNFAPNSNTQEDIPDETWVNSWQKNVEIKKKK